MNEWQLDQARRQDIIRTAQRHQQAAKLSQQTSMRKQIAEWLIETGQQLLKQDDPHYMPELDRA